MPYIGNVTTSSNVNGSQINNGTITGDKLSLPFDYDSATLYLDNTNNRVGILTASPSSTLTVGTGGVVSIPLASAATPSLVFGTDTNTGIYSPGADQVAISTNGTGRLFINGTGEVLAGTAASVDGNWKVQANAGASMLTGIGVNNNNDYGVYLTYDNSVRYSGAACLRNIANSPLAFETNNTERMRLTADGRLGLGTSAPSSRLHVSGGNILLSNAFYLSSRNAADSLSLALIGRDTSDIVIIDPDQYGTKIGGTTLVATSAGRVGIGSTGPQAQLDVVSSLGVLRLATVAGQTHILFRDTTNSKEGYLNFNNNELIYFRYANGPVEALRVDTSGRLLVGTSTSQGSYNLQCFGTGVWGQGAYVNGSDASIKQNVSNLPPSLDVVKNLRPVTFEYKPEYSQDQTIQAGFIAQELREAMQGQDYLDGIVQQGTNHLNVAYQSIIPVLTKALQEAIGRIETLEAEVAVLKGA